MIKSLIHQLHPIQPDKDLIRLGPKGDGGYLVPDDLENIKACFSPGVGETSEFEQECTQYGLEVFLADKSVATPELSNKKMHFIKKFIGAMTNENFITMDDWVSSSLQDSQSDLLLQMDIEGHEYLSICNMSDALLKRFRVIVIEFHNLHMLWSPDFFKLANTVFQKILQNHRCVHIHPNNCNTVDRMQGIDIPKTCEFTFYRNDRITKSSPRNNFPHPLDADCTDNKTLVLPKCWYTE